MSYRLYVRPRPPFADPDANPEAQLYNWVLVDASGDAQARGTADSRDVIEQTLTQNDLENVLLVGLIPGDGGEAGGILGSNIKKKYGSAEYFDVVFYHGAGLPARLTEPYASLRTVVMTTERACATDGCGRRLAEGKPNVVALGNPHEMTVSKTLNSLSARALLVHTPMITAEPTAAGRSASCTDEPPNSSSPIKYRPRPPTSQIFG